MIKYLKHALVLSLMTGCTQTEPKVAERVKNPLPDTYLERSYGKCFKNWRDGIITVERHGDFFKSDVGAYIYAISKVCDYKNIQKCVRHKVEIAWVNNGEQLRSYAREHSLRPIKCKP